MEEKKQKLILDCDPGHDDAVAIMLAGSCPCFDLLGITVVAGNQTLEKTVHNALNVKQHLGLDAPVYAGCERPIVRPRVVADDIHGESGLDGPAFAPLARKAEKQHAALFIIEQVLNAPGEITIVTAGPMTNLALAMRLNPKIIPAIRQVVFMGGCYQLGNVTPAAEFNIFADADAAHVVFTSGVKLTMVGLDVSRKAQCLPEVINRMAAIGNKASKLFDDMMRCFNAAQKRVYGWEGGPLHDPITIAYLINPNVLTLRPMFCEVDIRSEQSYGRTNCDYFGYLKKEPNVNVAIDIDVPLFWDIVEDGIRRYG
jgi:Inosine-uridine nucleoside N-ribohydrolase